MAKERDVAAASVRNSAKRAEVREMLQPPSDAQELLSLKLLLTYRTDSEQN
jgi:hypothetical protein